jgi:hypothetical protein
VDHDQLFKAVLTAQLPPFLELFFQDEAALLDLDAAQFVDKQLFAAPPMGPEREVDVLAEIPLRGAGTGVAGALVAIQIEVQAQREPEFVWRNLEYFALLRRLRGVPVFPIALFPLVDVLGSARRCSATRSWSLRISPSHCARWMPRPTSRGHRRSRGRSPRACVRPRRRRPAATSWPASVVSWRAVASRARRRANCSPMSSRRICRWRGMTPTSLNSSCESRRTSN